jgi:hypothetical protein
MTNSFDTEISSKPTAETENLLGGILTRLSDLLLEENSNLEAGVSSDHSNYIISKNQVLRELMSLQRTIQMQSLAPAMLDRLRETRKLVDRNHHLLKLQVAALNDVTSFLTQVAVAEQGDGTYTRKRQ